MHFHCNHCRSPLAIPAGCSLRELTCRACNRFVSIDVSERLVGHFQLDEKIGSGEYGSVWKAVDTESGRNVAIKFARRRHQEDGDSAHLLREVRLASQLQHYNIAQVYEAGQEDDWDFVVSDFIPGPTLTDWLGENSPSPKEATKLCIELANALDYAHGLGVVHRDLKPSNIMMRIDGCPCIIDFGLSKSTDDEVTMTLERYQRVRYLLKQDTSRDEKDGPVLGTPAYMSPEQARGEAFYVDHRSDIYSLGVILYELLTGRRPFRGSAKQVIKQVIRRRPKRPRAINRSISHDLETVCLKAMAKMPLHRYATALDMSEDCERVMSGAPILARPVSKVDRAWRLLRGTPKPRRP